MASSKANNQPASTEVEPLNFLDRSVNQFDDDKLEAISTMQDAYDALSEFGVGAEDFSEYGTGFEILDRDEKSQLVGKPLVILEWAFNESKKIIKDGRPAEFVSAAIVTKDGGKYIINDGSTGICQQLRRVTERRILKGHPDPYKGLTVQKGLRVSEYEYDDGSGTVTEAKTFYLA